MEPPDSHIMVMGIVCDMASFIRRQLGELLAHHGQAMHHVEHVEALLRCDSELVLPGPLPPVGETQILPPLLSSIVERQHVAILREGDPPQGQVNRSCCKRPIPSHMEGHGKDDGHNGGDERQPRNSPLRLYRQWHYVCSHLVELAR